MLGFFGFSIFTIACATAKDTQTLMISRFFAGLFSASPVTLVPASLSDLFNNMHRGIAIASYTLAMFTGPYTAPFVAGYIAESYLGWRFVFYIPAFVSFFNTALLVLFARETYAPIVLVHKAALLRRPRSASDVFWMRLSTTSCWGIGCEFCTQEALRLLELFQGRPPECSLHDPLRA